MSHVATCHPLGPRLQNTLIFRQVGSCHVVLGHREPDDVLARPSAKPDVACPLDGLVARPKHGMGRAFGRPGPV
jgi:hypothetical protein